MKVTYFNLLICIVLFFSGCEDEDMDTQLPDTIQFSSQSLYPEGFDYDAGNKAFLVSSITQGDVFKVDQNGQISRFIIDPSLISSTGIKIDNARKRVIVCSGDVQASQRSSAATAFITASVGIYDLNTGARQRFYELGKLRPTGHFASDAAVDVQGNIYVTDSFGPFIYKINDQGATSVFLEDTAKFTPDPNEFGLNGLVYHNDKFLIVAKTDNGFLYKVPIDKPNSFTRIASEAFPGVDGIALEDDNTLLLAINTGNKVIRIQTKDNWSSASKMGETATPDVFPTTVNPAGKDFYVLYSYLNKLLAGQADQAIFELKKLAF